jgi:hypothetical protein
MPLLCLLFLVVVGVDAHAVDDLTRFLPTDREVPGWERDAAVRSFQGDDLFMMINGGADIYHECGFSQVVAASYFDEAGETVKVEIYEMKDPAAAYSIYTFKSGDGGKELPLGQAARLQDYYLNFWKGDLLVTLVGSSSEGQALQSVLDIARAVDGKIDRTGEVPGLAQALTSGSVALSDAKYVRGPLGVMNSYVFDTRNIFHVREGVLGNVAGCRVFVFQYADTEESAAVFDSAADVLVAGSRFNSPVRKGRMLSMADRDGEGVQIRCAGEFIVVVVGPQGDQSEAVLNRIAEKFDTVR